MKNNANMPVKHTALTRNEQHAQQDETLQKVAERYAVSITPYIGQMIGDDNDPLGRQYLPRAEELDRTEHEDDDPIGDSAHSPVKGIIHRYPDRILLMPVSVCAVYCRFCFRREVVGPQSQRKTSYSGTLTKDETKTALAYIRENTDIWEVILSGGDPLMLSPARLKDLIAALNEIPHVQTIRIHTRMPVVDPERINDDLCAALRSEKAMYVSVHTNHVREITEQAKTAFTRLRQADCSLVSQTVLLKDINDDTNTLETLFRKLVACRVKPYYLHHPDKAPGTAHFRVPIKAGQKIMAELRARLSGLALPTYMLDIPGGVCKVPVGPSYINAAACAGSYEIIDHQGRQHKYKDD